MKSGEGLIGKLGIDMWLSWITLGVQIFAFIFFALSAPRAVSAAVFSCSSGNVACLINAINTANSNGVADTINLDGSTFTLTSVDNDTDGPNGLPDITSKITINGNGSIIERSSASDAPEFRIFHVAGGGNLTLNHLTVRNVLTPFFGGGIVNDFGAGLTVTNSTFSGNSSSFGVEGGSRGGGIENFATLTVTNSTFSGNSAVSAGGCISNLGGTITLLNTIIANSTSGGNCTNSVDFGSTLTDGGYNIDDDGSCNLSTANHSHPNTNPQLDPAGLRNNGGPTQTIALCTASGTPNGCTGISPAIDAIPKGTNGCGTDIITDQRGFIRPDPEDSSNPTCDIGAFESGAVLPPVINSLVTFTPNKKSFSTSSDTTGCPSGFVGKFSFSATLTDKPTSPSVSDLIVQVTTLTNGNLLENADGGPAGVGATLTLPGTLSPGQSEDVQFTICLKQKGKFSFFVDVLGIVQ